MAWLSTTANADVGSGYWQLTADLRITVAKSGVGSGEWQLRCPTSAVANLDVSNGEWQLALAVRSTMAQVRCYLSVCPKIAAASRNLKVGAASMHCKSSVLLRGTENVFGGRGRSQAVPAM